MSKNTFSREREHIFCSCIIDNKVKVELCGKMVFIKR